MKSIRESTIEHHTSHTPIILHRCTCILARRQTHEILHTKTRTHSQHKMQRRKHRRIHHTSAYSSAHATLPFSTLLSPIFSSRPQTLRLWKRSRDDRKERFQKLQLESVSCHQHFLQFPAPLRYACRAVLIFTRYSLRPIFYLDCGFGFFSAHKVPTRHSRISFTHLILNHHCFEFGTAVIDASTRLSAQHPKSTKFLILVQSSLARKSQNYS